MTDWVDFAYTVVALLVVALLMYVMQKVEYDRWSKTDPIWLQWVRRLAFTITALALLYSISSVDWKFTCFTLVSASAIILAINALALALRSPPPNRGRMHAHARGWSIARIGSALAGCLKIARGYSDGSKRKGP